MKKQRSEKSEEKAKRGGRIFQGTVVKSTMQDTCTVEVVRFFKHPKYQKYMRRSKRYLVHDKGNTAQLGAAVAIRETSPISKRKRFRLVREDADRS